MKIAVIIVLPSPLLWNKHLSFSSDPDDSILGRQVMWDVPELTFKKCYEMLRNVPSTCVDDKSVLCVHMFIDSTIITIDFHQNIVLTHTLRIFLCCWSLTAHSQSLDWTGHVIQDKEQSEIGQEGQCQNYQGRNDYGYRSNNCFPQTCWVFIPVGFLSFTKMLALNIILKIYRKSLFIK